MHRALSPFSEGERAGLPAVAGSPATEWGHSPVVDCGGSPVHGPGGEPTGGSADRQLSRGSPVPGVSLGDLLQELSFGGCTCYKKMPIQHSIGGGVN